MQIKTGNLFDSYAGYIGHGVNTHGVMGAGIAKQFREKFPRNYEVYRNSCLEGSLKVGEYLAIPERKDGDGPLRVVVNFVSQDAPGPNARYEWLFTSLWTWAEQAAESHRLNRFGGIIAVPQIGCGIGGLEWKKVKRIMKVVEDCHEDIEFEVWSL